MATNGENMQSFYVFILYTQSHLQCLFDAYNDVHKPDMTSFLAVYLFKKILLKLLNQAHHNKLNK